MQRVILGGRLLHFITYPDFSFRDKWSGVYYLDEKIANYIAVKTEHGWVAPENTDASETVWNESKISFRSTVNEHDITTEIKIKDNGLEIMLLGSNMNILEMGICYRHAYDDKCRENVVVGENTVRMGKIVAHIKGGSIARAEKRIQEQGGEIYSINVVRIPFVERVTLTFEHPIRLTQTRKETKTSFRSDSTVWNVVYTASKSSIAVLTKRRGWYAGLPWFVQYWARDSFLSLPALVREGYAPLARRLLLDFLYSKVDGEIPRLIREDGTPEFGSVDANPLFLNAVLDYVRISGDYAFIQENKQDILEVYNWIVTEFPDYVIRSRGKDTWMDTLETRKYPVEVQAFAMEAARKLDWMGITSGEYPKFKEAFEESKTKFLLEKSANILLAAAYRLIPPEEAIKLAEQWRLISEWGIRSLSPDDVDYDPRGYHTGSAWGLTTATGLYVALLAERYDVAEKMVEVLARRAKHTKYIDEVWSADTGEKIGADVQLWSAAIVIRAIDEVLIKKRRMPEDISSIKRTWWERGNIRHTHLSRNNH